MKNKFPKRTRPPSPISMSVAVGAASAAGQSGSLKPSAFATPFDSHPSTSPGKKLDAATAWNFSDFSGKTNEKPMEKWRNQ